MHGLSTRPAHDIAKAKNTKWHEWGEYSGRMTNDEMRPRHRLRTRPTHVSSVGVMFPGSPVVTISEFATAAATGARRDAGKLLSRDHACLATLYSSTSDNAGVPFSAPPMTMIRPR